MQAAEKCQPEEREPDIVDVESFKRALLRRNYKANTVENYSRYVRLVAEIVGTDPRGWTPEDLAGLLYTERFDPRKGWKPSTQSIARAALKSYLMHHHRDDLLGGKCYEFWATRGSDQADLGDMRERAVPREDVERVMEYCKDRILHSRYPSEVDRCMKVYMLAALGLRCVGLRHLRVKDVNLEDDTAHVPRSKGGKTRTVPMHGQVTTEMWERFLRMRTRLVDTLVGREGDNALTRLLRTPEGPLFFKHGGGDDRNPAGGKVTRGSLNGTVGDLTKAILGTRWNPHALRHAKAYYLLEEWKWPIQKVAHYLGHVSVSTTFLYTHANVEDMREPNGHTNGAVAPAVARNDIEEKIAHLTDKWASGEMSTDNYDRAMERLENRR